MLTMCYNPISALTLKVEEKRKTETDHERKNHFLNFGAFDKTINAVGIEALKNICNW